MTTFTTEDRIAMEIENNKPVAWMLADKEAEHIRSIMAVQHDFVPEGCVEIPLYTHPVKELDRELLDKTIIDQQNEIKVLREQLRWALIAKEDVGHNFNVVSLQLQQKAQDERK